MSLLERLEIEGLAERWERAARVRRGASERGVMGSGLVHSAEVYERCAGELRALLEQLKALP